MSKKIFIGHGHSPVWEDLRDFLSTKLELPCDYFEAVPTAGITHTKRLEEMKANACFAFLVMTAEDVHKNQTLEPVANLLEAFGSGVSHAQIVPGPGQYDANHPLNSRVIID